MKKIIQTNLGHRIPMIIMLALFLGTLFMTEPAFAAAAADSCTDQPIYDVFLDSRLDSILMDIVELVQDALDGVMESLYTGIIESSNYQTAVWAAMTLYIAFYGVGFTLGFVPGNFSQALMRVVKIGLVAWIMSDSGFDMFNDTVVRVFADGTDWLIDLMIDIAGGDSADGHFSIMEPIMIKVFSPKMFIMIVGSITTGPFGIIMALALLWSVYNLFIMVLKALEIYLLSLIIRTLLLGMGPLFFAFMFFERTKQIFMGYINQLVAFSLQPVLLFAFLAFFVGMLESAVDALITPTGDHTVELCYTKMEHLGKMPFDMQHWRFKIDGDIYEGEWTYKGPLGKINFPFPIHVIDILIFLILAHLGIKMSKVVVEVAAEIAQSSVRLTDVPNTLNSYFNNLSGGGGHGMSTAEMAWRSRTK